MNVTKFKHQIESPPEVRQTQEKMAVKKRISKNDKITTRS
jgi:hypothetical protein